MIDNSTNSTAISIKNVTNSTLLSRKKRVAPIVIGGAKLFAWTVAMATAGVTASAIDTAIKDSRAQERMATLKRRVIECSTNNFGCFASRCWSNCGPRLTAADWCFTTNDTNTKNIQYIKCTRNSDCQPCWHCGGVCLMEGEMSDTEISVLDGTVTKP